LYLRSHVRRCLLDLQLRHASDHRRSTAAADQPRSSTRYRVPPRHFERIAIIDSPAGTSWIFPDRPSMELGISRLREQAAALGANGILLARVYDVSAGGLAIGGGGFGYSGHSFYGGGGNVGGPLINHRVQAAAIYVR
jgi:hypothetical protein